MGLFKKMFMCKPFCCHREAYFFCRPKQSEGSSHGVPRYCSAGQKGALGMIKKGACQDEVRDFFETARGLKFGLAIIFFA